MRRPDKVNTGPALRIRTRRGAIGMILGLQALVLVLGGILTFTQLRHATAEAVQDLVLDENVRIAEWLSDQLASGIDAPLAYGSPEWEIVQSRVEGLTLPGAGFACLLDPEGKILCHPQLRADPRIRGRPLGNLALSPGAREENIMLSAAPAAGSVAGRLRFSPGETHYVATRAIPALGVRLLVHQPESGIVSLSARALLFMSAVAGVGALSILGLTALATLWVMQRYDNALERINRGLEDEVERRTQQNLAARDALIVGLAKLADCRDSETGLHLERIGAYSALLAAKLAETHPEIDDAWIERLRLASSMHDIGKVGLPDEILLKPGPLTDAERRRMQTHTTIGADTLIAIRARLGDDDLLDTSIQIALEHHERWDGTGYPMRLAGEQIALPARIVALADVYDALTSRRVYKPAMSHAEAKRIILEGHASHFDPRVVDAFLAIERSFDEVRLRLRPAESLTLARAA